MKPPEQGPDTSRIEEDLLERYLAGECTPDERGRVERWSAARPGNAELLIALRASLDPTPEQSTDVDAAWARLSSHLAAQAEDHTKGAERPSVVAGEHQARPGALPAPSVPSARPRVPEAIPVARPPRIPGANPVPRLPRKPEATPAARPSRFPAVLVRLAAVLVVALGLVAVWRAVGGPGGAPFTEVALVEYTAPVGSTRELRLADGSLVTLAPASRLQVPEDLSGARDVILEGEAFFRVTHDEARPFRVLSNGNAARVLGTEFDVRTGRGAEALRVAVASGRVGVGREDADPAAVLEPGQMAVLDSAGTAQVGPADLDRLLAWTRGRIELDQLTLTDALLELERWYDVDLEVADPALASRRVTASFRAEPIEQVLESITLALAARYERVGRVYRVIPASPR